MGVYAGRLLALCALLVVTVAEVQGAIFGRGQRETTNDIAEANREPFSCLGTDVCNRRGTDWQYCDEVREKRCRYCSNDKQLCMTRQMPKNCTDYCVETLLETEKVKGCPPLSQVPHGVHNGSETGTRYGDVIGVKCDAGYHCGGSCTVTCDEFGQYTGSLICKEMSCPQLLAPAHGYYSPVKKDYSVGELVKFHCHDGFHLEGNRIANCTSGGSWSITEIAACIPQVEKDESNDMVVLVVVLGIVSGVLALTVVLEGLAIAYFKCYKQRKAKTQERNSRLSDQENDALLGNNPAQGLNASPERLHHASGMSRSIPLRSETDPSLLSRYETDLPRAHLTNCSAETMTSSCDSGYSGAEKKERSDVTNNIHQNTNNNPQNIVTINVCTQSQNEPKPDITTEPPNYRPDLKFPTEASRDETKAECHGELQDDTNGPDEAAEPDNILGDESDRKEPYVTDEPTHGSQQSLGFPVKEEQKIHDRDPLVVQSQHGDNKSPTFAIGERNISHCRGDNAQKSSETQS